MESNKLRLQTGINATVQNFDDAPHYCKILPVMAYMLAVETTFQHDWGHQIMAPGSILIIDPSTSTCWGCEAKTFALTYSAVPTMPGYFTKTAPVRAKQMNDVFFVTALDPAKVPEVGGPGDYLVETVREDGVNDRYLIKERDFERMYRLVPAGK